VKTIAFFHDKSGVGNTSLVYHLAWMYADLGLNVVAADLDPQADLTTMFLDDNRLEELWEQSRGTTVHAALLPLLEGTGEIADADSEPVDDGLALIAGDLRMSAAENELSTQWSACLDGKPQAFRMLSGLWRILKHAAKSRETELVLIDVGPSLGALSRAALVAATHVVLPVAPDLGSLLGPRTLGPTLRQWRWEWAQRLALFAQKPVPDLEFPFGDMRPCGYVVLPRPVRLDRPVKAQGRWMGQIPRVYRDAVLDVHEADPTTVDPHCLGTLRHFGSLRPLAQEARKPMFFLKPADGAIGGHTPAVSDCYDDFRALAGKIAGACGVAIP
jgi:cellulose biosynthesis protein BcsQ